MINIAKIQFITLDGFKRSHIEQVKDACEAGCDWVQLRVKNRPEEEVLDIALKARNICLQHNVKLIINDFVDVAIKCEADGVHLGQEDISIAEAIKSLGPNKIVGGTANTLDQVQKLSDLGVSYIGLGPFKFTSTKKNLSPILGLNGYRKILSAGNFPPIIAIGGITRADISDLLSTGVYGVALSSYLTQSENIKSTYQTLKNEFQTPTYEN